MIVITSALTADSVWLQRPVNDFASDQRSLEWMGHHLERPHPVPPNSSVITACSLSRKMLRHATSGLSLLVQAGEDGCPHLTPRKKANHCRRCRTIPFYFAKTIIMRVIETRRWWKQKQSFLVWQRLCVHAALINKNVQPNQREHIK